VRTPKFSVQCVEGVSRSVVGVNILTTNQSRWKTAKNKRAILVIPMDKTRIRSENTKSRNEKKNREKDCVVGVGDGMGSKSLIRQDDKGEGLNFPVGKKGWWHWYQKLFPGGVMQKKKKKKKKTRRSWTSKFNLESKLLTGMGPGSHLPTHNVWVGCKPTQN